MLWQGYWWFKRIINYLKKLKSYLNLLFLSEVWLNLKNNIGINYALNSRDSFLPIAQQLKDNLFDLLKNYHVLFSSPQSNSIPSLLVQSAWFTDLERKNTCKLVVFLFLSKLFCRFSSTASVSIVWGPFQLNHLR